MYANIQPRKLAANYLVDGESGFHDVVNINKSYNKQYCTSLFTEKNVLKSIKEAKDIISRTERGKSVEEQIIEVNQMNKRKSKYATFFSKQDCSTQKRQSVDHGSFEHQDDKGQMIRSNSLEKSTFTQRSFRQTNSEIKKKDPLKKLFANVSQQKFLGKGMVSTAQNQNFKPFFSERDSLGFILDPINDFAKEFNEDFKKKLPNLPTERQHISLIVPPSKENVLLIKKGVHYFDKGIKLRSKRYDDHVILKVFDKKLPTAQIDSNLPKEDGMLHNSSSKNTLGISEAKTPTKYNHNQSQEKTIVPSVTQISSPPSVQQMSQQKSATSSEMKNFSSQVFQKDPIFPTKKYKDIESSAQFSIQEHEFSSPTLVASNLPTSHLKYPIDDRFNTTSPMNLTNTRSKFFIDESQSTDLVSSKQKFLEEKINHKQKEQLQSENQPKGLVQSASVSSISKNINISSNLKEQKYDVVKSHTSKQQHQPYVQVKMKQKGGEGVEISLGRFVLETSKDNQIQAKSINESDEEFWQKAECSKNAHFKWRMNALDLALFQASMLNKKKIRSVIKSPNTEDQRNIYKISPYPPAGHYDPNYALVQMNDRQIVFDKAKTSDSPNPSFTVPNYTKEPPLPNSQKEQQIPTQIKEEGYEKMFNELMKDIKSEVRMQRVQTKELYHPLKGYQLTPIPHQDILDIHKEINIKSNYCKNVLNNMKYFLKSDNPKSFKNKKMK